MFQDPSRVELLVDQIFFEVPTFSLGDYMPSALLDLRRAMTRDTQLVADEVLRRPPRLPKWLKMNIALPPWESEFLYNLFADYPFSVIQGGSGCGKTSALVYAATYCAKLVDKLRREGKVPLVDKMILAVDLQPQGEYLKTSFTTKVEQNQQLAEFLRAFCSVLDTELLRSLTDASIGRLFERTFLQPIEPANVLTTPVLDVRFRIGSNYSSSFPGQPPCWSSVIEALDSESVPHARVVARYLLLQELARQQRDRCGTKLVLAIDNIDPYPDYLQTALIRTFQAVTHGYHAHGGAFLSPFSICLLARHSTTTRRSGALDGVEAHRVQFRAADPAELIFYRLSAFLLAPERVNTWNELDERDHARISDRLWLLWQRLIVPQDQFSRVFSGLAGTNCRTGCKIARWWILSARMQVVSGNRPADNFSLARAIGTALLLRVAAATARAIQVGGPCGSANSLISELPERLFSDLLGILIGNYIVRRADGVQLLADDLRSNFSERARGSIKELLSFNDPNNRAGNAAAFPLRTAAHEVAWQVTKETKNLRVLCRQLKEALIAMEARRRHELDKLRQEDQEIAVAACMWLCEAIVRGVGGAARGTLSDESVIDALVGGRSMQDRLKPNRWESVSILISPEEELSRSERSAINVFSADGVTVSPVALHVLCSLQEAKHGLDALVIKERLALWGFGETEMRVAVRGMVDVDHRLVYSKVMDDKEGTLDWFDAFHSVHISSAGSEYLKLVIPAPAYLQWALLEPSMLREAVGGARAMNRLGTGLGRIAVAFEGLQHLRADEMGRLKKMGNRRPHEVQKSLSPALWVLFASLSRFISDISGLRSVDKQEALRVAALFLEFGKNQYTEFQETFGMVPDEWGFELGAAELEYRRRFGKWRAS